MEIWQSIYFTVVYLAAALCVIAAIRQGISGNWPAGLAEVATLILFGVGYWLLESFAHMNAPYYVYPAIFPDMVPFFDFGRFGVGPGDPPDAHKCAKEGFDQITLTVPLLEMSMTYCLMRTARLILTPRGWGNSIHASTVAPFMVGLIALTLDGFLDPVVSSSYICDPVTLNHEGMGYWIWYAQPDMANYYYGIPMFNYAAWYSAPVVLVATVIFMHWLHHVIRYAYSLFRDDIYPKPSVVNGLFLLAIIMTFLTIRLTAPGINPPWLQVGAIFLAIGVSLTVVAKHRKTYARNNPINWFLLVPIILVFTTPLATLFLSGKFNVHQQWPLAAISVSLATLGMAFAVAPYSRKSAATGSG